LSVGRVTLIIAAVALAIVAVFVAYRALDERAAPPIVIEDAAVTRPVVVDVRGAVIAPGVYELPPDARIQDAVAAAGGLTADADLSTINLARRLRDGEVVLVSALPTPGTPPAPPPNAGQASASETGKIKININSATATELEQLPGIGEVIAGRIVAFREENGAFRAVDDLILIDGISARTIDRIRDLVTTGS
jgi:competence protein ComEA